ncbi:MAG: response regulator [Anaerolineae bacterium]|nr:response regulator [Anaerolineae bacterium]MCI0610102.1 response regulator [Anaerolineae bacterium]
MGYDASILIVDDTLTGRKALELLLKEEGYRLAFASNGDEALRRAGEFEPDVILLDVMMPGMDGFEVCLRMRNDPNFLDVPILLLSSLTDRDDRLKGIGAGADDFISKPFDKLELLIRVRTITRLNRFRRLREEHAQLESALLALQHTYDTTIEGWVQALDLRDKESEGHTRRVTDMTVQLARIMGIDEETLSHYRRGALLHDVGKLGIPDSILHKNGSLTDEELAIMRRHPQYAFQWLSRIDYLRPALEIPYCHHEKWDGSGYPRGMKGEEIPLEARIFAVVDVWDALLSDRPYKTARPAKKAAEFIRSQKNIHFDPKIVDIFLEHFAHQLAGNHEKNRYPLQKQASHSCCG